MPITTAQAHFIFERKLGCRYGTTTAGAAYGFLDIVGGGQSGGPVNPLPAVMMQWIQTPDATDFEPRWDNRLWNTCGVIVGFSAAGNVMLVTQAAPVAERYRFSAPSARGDGFSFRKCNRLPDGSAILATIPYGNARHTPAPEREDYPHLPADAAIDDKVVAKLYAAVSTAIAKLAG